MAKSKLLHLHKHHLENKGVNKVDRLDITEEINV